MNFPYRESEPYNGVLCNIKENIHISYHSKIEHKLYADPSKLICNSGRSVDFYAHPTDINDHLDFIFYSKVVKITNYSISGRQSTSNCDLMQTWELKGLTLDNKWITLDAQSNKPLYSYQWFNFSSKVAIIKGISIQVTGQSYGLSNSIFNYINTMGGFEIFGKVFSQKCTRQRMYPKQNHLCLLLMTITLST